MVPKTIETLVGPTNYGDSFWLQKLLWFLHQFKLWWLILAQHTLVTPTSTTLYGDWLVDLIHNGDLVLIRTMMLVLVTMVTLGATTHNDELLDHYLVGLTIHTIFSSCLTHFFLISILSFFLYPSFFSFSTSSSPLLISIAIFQAKFCSCILIPLLFISPSTISTSTILLDFPYWVPLALIELLHCLFWFASLSTHEAFI